MTSPLLILTAGLMVAAITFGSEVSDNNKEDLKVKEVKHIDDIDTTNYNKITEDRKVSYICLDDGTEVQLLDTDKDRLDSMLKNVDKEEISREYLDESYDEVLEDIQMFDAESVPLKSILVTGSEETFLEEYNPDTSVSKFYIIRNNQLNNLISNIIKSE